MIMVPGGSLVLNGTTDFPLYFLRVGELKLKSLLPTRHSAEAGDAASAASPESRNTRLSIAVLHPFRTSHKPELANIILQKGHSARASRNSIPQTLRFWRLATRSST